ncbi:MAG: NADH-quinone oxidoreductase subunit L [Actinomycetota bacterium]|nr:NADH-quinone oxidoreductase subunit L [Actinomycetota bacterium]
MSAATIVAPTSAATFAWLVLAFPLAATVGIALAWRALPGRSAGWIASGSVLASFICSIGATLGLEGLPEHHRKVTASAYEYVNTAGLHVDVGIFLDPLAALMMLTVSGVSFLIFLYSVSYMTSDRGYARYFSYLSFFVFSMLLLVMAGNLVLLVVGWAFVGAASFLLISFWYRRRTATGAGIKAFVINVIGDVALVVGVFILFSRTGALEWEAVFEGAKHAFAPDDGVLVAACLLLVAGAFAKSAQLPLHTWLPDAMEGPTPVSALIHAATMVTAGVYLIARAHPLFEHAPTAADTAAILATVSLLFAASVALVITDLKRIIAYSTISQVGYMVLGVSIFAHHAGMFHLVTHAFFKALLFMAAGSVIGAMSGLQSLERMGGFRRAMPFTFATFTVGALALAGAPLFSGFFSKDEIIGFAVERGGLYFVLGAAASVGALLTAFYSFRMVFRVFFGEPVDEARSLEQGELVHGRHVNPTTGEEEDTDVGTEGPEHQIAEREWPMKAAMYPLAALALAGGVLGIPGVTELNKQFLHPTFAASPFVEFGPKGGAAWAGLAIGGAISLLGIALAYVLYIRRPGTTAALRRAFAGVHTFLERRWYFDELFDLVFVRPVAAFGRFGRTVVEGAFVQGLIVGGPSGLVRAGSSLARAIQAGYVRAYAMLLLVGLSGLGLYFLLAAG